MELPTELRSSRCSQLSAHWLLPHSSWSVRVEALCWRRPSQVQAPPQRSWDAGDRPRAVGLGTLPFRRSVRRAPVGRTRPFRAIMYVSRDPETLTVWWPRGSDYSSPICGDQRLSEQRNGRGGGAFSGARSGRELVSIHSRERGVEHCILGLFDCRVRVVDRERGIFLCTVGLPLARTRGRARPASRRCSRGSGRCVRSTSAGDRPTTQRAFPFWRLRPCSVRQLEPWPIPAPPSRPFRVRPSPWSARPRRGPPLLWLERRACSVGLISPCSDSFPSQLLADPIRALHTGADALATGRTHCY